MPCSCIRHTDLPHATKLFADFVYHFDRVHKFYPYAPYAPQSFAEAASGIHLTREHRLKLADELAAQNASAGPEAVKNLDRLRAPETLAVVTGQQAGLYTGPVYTIY